MTDFNRPLNELTTEERNFAVDVLNLLQSDVMAGLQETNGNVKLLKQTYRDIQKQNDRMTTVITMVLAFLCLIFPIIGLPLILYYLIKIRPAYKLSTFCFAAYEEILDYYYAGIMPDHDYGNKISWERDNAGEVLEKALGLSGGTAVSKCVETLWNNPSLIKIILNGGSGENSENRSSNLRQFVNQTLNNDLFRAIKSSLSVLANKIMCLTICLITFFGTCGGIALYFGFEHKHSLIQSTVGGTYLAIISGVLFLVSIIYTRKLYHE